MSDERDDRLEELSVEECWRHLALKSVGRLAVSIANRPDVFPVNYRLDNETIVVRTAPGLKLAAATLGDAVAFEVDSLDELMQTGWSIVVQGTAREIDGTEELLEADHLHVQPWAGGPKRRYLRIVPDRITGRRIPSITPNPRPLAPGAES